MVDEHTAGSELNGTAKAAVLLLSLGEEHAADRKSVV